MWLTILRVSFSRRNTHSYMAFLGFASLFPLRKISEEGVRWGSAQALTLIKMPAAQVSGPGRPVHGKQNKIKQNTMTMYPGRKNK